MYNETKSGGIPFSIFLIFILVIIVLSRFVGAFASFGSLNSDAVNGREYDGRIEYSTSRRVPKMSYILPSGFVDLGSRNGIAASYENLNSEGFMIQCRVFLGFVDNYVGAEDLAIGKANYHDTTYELVSINNIDWYRVNYKRFFHNDIYLTTYNNRILMYQFDGTESCMPYSDEIIKSIAFK